MWRQKFAIAQQVIMRQGIVAGEKIEAGPRHPDGELPRDRFPAPPQPTESSEQMRGEAVFEGPSKSATSSHPAVRIVTAASVI